MSQGEWLLTLAVSLHSAVVRLKLYFPLQAAWQVRCCPVLNSQIVKQSAASSIAVAEALPVPGRVCRIVELREDSPGLRKAKTGWPAFFWAVGSTLTLSAVIRWSTSDFRPGVQLNLSQTVLRSPWFEAEWTAPALRPE
jgi:hypothetical protein